MLAFRGNRADVVQWQNISFPSLIRGFDSRHRLRCDTSTLMVMLNVGGPAARRGRPKTMAGPCTVVADRAVWERPLPLRCESGWCTGTVADRAVLPPAWTPPAAEAM